MPLTRGIQMHTDLCALGGGGGGCMACTELDCTPMCHGVCLQDAH